MKNKALLIVVSTFLLSCGRSGAISSSFSSESSISDKFSSDVATSEASESVTSFESEDFSDFEAESVASSEKEVESVSSDTSEILESSETSSSEEPAVSSSDVSSDTSISESSIPEEEESLDPVDEPYFGEQVYLNHIGDICTSWESYRGKGVTIAVIDAGFNPYHEDFYYKDGTSKVSPLSASFEQRGGSTVTSVGIDNVVNMGDSHGTFCAGVASAAINGKGVVGIAPESTLLLLKTDKRPKSIEKAFRYAADNGAKVVTISIGSFYDYRGDLIDDGSDLGTVFDPAIAYCRNKGVVICSAGGNGGLSDEPTEFTFPGCCDYVIGAGGLAFNSSTSIWDGSSYNSSPDYVFCDVFAPADEMFGCCHYDNKIYDGGWNGTSFASPIVAGMAALYFEKNPSKTPADFENALFSSCVRIVSDQTPTTDQLGHGRVDVGRLLGTKASSSITTKIKAPWSEAYCYMWNSISGNASQSWPGKKMSSGGGFFTAEVNANLYDSVIFTSGTSQTVDLMASSFGSGRYYSLANATNKHGVLIGEYLQ